MTKEPTPITRVDRPLNVIWCDSEILGVHVEVDGKVYLLNLLLVTKASFDSMERGLTRNNLELDQKNRVLMNMLDGLVDGLRG